MKYQLPPGYEPIATVPRNTEVNVIYSDGATHSLVYVPSDTPAALGWAPITPLQKIERWTWETDDNRLAIAIYKDGQCADCVWVCDYGSTQNAEAIAKAICDTANGFEEQQ